MDGRWVPIILAIIVTVGVLLFLAPLIGHFLK